MDIIKPKWPTPPSVHAFTTTREGGISLPPFNSLNLGDHVHDNPDHVATNRTHLMTACALPNAPIWLTQTHSTRCLAIDTDNDRDGDAAITRTPRQVLAIMTADCVPILISDKSGKAVAAIHAGWRGLLDGVIDNTLLMLSSPSEDLIVWIGPHICGGCFQVGDDVRDAFIKANPANLTAFKPDAAGKWLANLEQLAKSVLQTAGIQAIYSSNMCTFESTDRFFSYRREGQTGRMVSLIWFD